LSELRSSLKVHFLFNTVIGGNKKRRFTSDAFNHCILGKYLHAFMFDMYELAVAIEVAYLRNLAKALRAV
jgi:hypothetical protein